jgi:hypothetical protein
MRAINAARNRFCRKRLLSPIERGVDDKLARIRSRETPPTKKIARLAVRELR